MRISAKGRYALAAMIHLGQHNHDQCIPVIDIAEKLDISKIYLEQVFSLLKRGELVESIKGAHGGYKLTAPPDQISGLSILEAIEVAVFEETKETVGDKVPGIDVALQVKLFSPLDEAVKKALASVSLADLVEEVKNQKNDDNYMFFI